MKKKDINETLTRYEKRYQKYGNSIKTLASGNATRRKIRFKILEDIGIKKNSSVLDVGCGFGDFYKFLKGKNKNIIYHGIDIVPEHIKEAKKKFPIAKFDVKDIFSLNFKKKYDYVVCSQVFNHKLSQDNFKLVKKIIPKMYSLSSKGCVIDFLTNYVDYKEKHLYYYNPEKVFKYAKTISKNVTLRHDYNLFEFSLYILKDFSGWNKRN
jgi:2-polyprenyl-3-methyl-5-hydroxy-6-metoxy-1,4-benzoquinol methylase